MIMNKHTFSMWHSNHIYPYMWFIFNFTENIKYYIT